MKIPASHIITPGGARHKSRVHRASHAHVVHAADGALHQATASGWGDPLPTLAAPTAGADPGPPIGPGWIESAGFRSDDVLERVVGSWVVPPPPTLDRHQVVFLFLGCQTDRDDATDLLQPVLQWGFNGSEGGDYWGVSCWYQHGGPSEPQPLLVSGNYVRVDPGDRVQVTVKRVVWRGIPSWECSAAPGGDKPVASLHISQTPTFRWSHVGLESYHAPPEARGLYPDTTGTVFSGLDLHGQQGPLAPVWTPEVKAPGPGRRVEVKGASEVVLHY